jgi:hypothetical protein
MVFGREGGGHVGFYDSEDSVAYNITGGNQSDMVNTARIDKKRFLGARWPKDVLIPSKPKRLMKKLTGFFSRNEA